MKAAIAAALVHFLWQGAAIGALAWIGFALSRSPRVRYLIGIAALALMAIAPVVTGVVFARAVEVPGPSSPVHGPLSFPVPGPTSGSVDPGRGAVNGSEPWTGDRGRWTLTSVEPLDTRVATAVLIAWLVGVVALSIRLVFGWLGIRAVTRRVSATGAHVQDAARRLIGQLRIRATVRVVESALVKVPSVVGAFKPVVLLPAAAMSGLSIEQVEALLAHELAHVRRHDYLVNLLQSAVETLLFYHPAVWLVSRRVRQERELCCDDLALAVCADRVAYASALADLESLRAIPSPAIAANGGSLLSRVRRILGHDEVSALAGRSQSVAGVAILASIILLAGGQAARARAVVTATDPDSRRAEWATGSAGASAQAETPRQILKSEQSKRQLIEVEKLGLENAKVKAVDFDLAALRAQLKSRLMQIVDMARQEFENAKAAEARYKQLYLRQEQQLTSQSAPGAPSRATIERIDPKTGKLTNVKLNKNPMTTPIEPGDVIRVPKRRM